MGNRRQKSYIANSSETEGKWYLVDANEQVLGRLASRVAMVLRGKHRADFTPHVDLGDHVVVINADKVQVKGRKGEDKLYFRHSGYPGGIRSRSFNEMVEKFPERTVTMAVRRMLPRNSLGRKLLTKLRVYAGTEHKHEAQNPQPLDLTTIR